MSCAALESRRRLFSALKETAVREQIYNLEIRGTLEISGPAEWNSLPEAIQKSSSINTYKTKLKNHLFS